MDRPDAIVRAAVAACIIGIGAPVAFGVSWAVAPECSEGSWFCLTNLPVFFLLLLTIGGVAGCIGRGQIGFAAAMLGIPVAEALARPISDYTVEQFVFVGLTVAVPVAIAYASALRIRRAVAGSHNAGHEGPTDTTAEARGRGPSSSQ